MAIVSRGFKGRGRSSDPELPPGQYLVTDFPVLSAGPTPRVDLRRWQLKLVTETGDTQTWDWPALQALPREDITVDLHCVTKWSKLGTRWTGISLDTLLDGVTTAAGFALVGSYGGYTTNLPLADLRDGQAWIAFSYAGGDLDRGARRPCPAAGPAPVPVEVGQVGERDPAAGAGHPGLLGERRLPQLR